MDYGLPHRPPTASTAVWNHLLRTTATMEPPKSLKDMPIIAPPMAPLDKNATSMRVLLHDTQANFEKFNTQVEKILETIQDTKNELKTMQSLFQRDRDTLTGDIVDLVNRSQREIQKSIGTPVQSDSFESLCKNINHRLDGLDQKLEAMNAFNQTHSQALQTQMHTVQLILDKQGSILSAVTPVLPSLQGLPPLIEALRTVLTEKLRELSTSLKDCHRSDTPPSKSKRPFAELGTASVSLASDDATRPPELSRKRSRVMDLSDAQPSANDTSRVTDDSRGSSTTPLMFTSSSPRFPISAPIETFSRTVQPQKKQSSTTQGLTTPRRDRGNFVVPPLPPPSTSRSRLNTANLTGSGADHGFSSVTLSASPLLPVPVGLSAECSRPDASTHATAPTPQGRSNAPNFFGMTPTATRPPRMRRVHTSIAARSRSNSVVSVAEIQDLPNLTREAPPVIGRMTRSSTRALICLAPPQPSIEEDKETVRDDAKKGLAATLSLPRPPQPSVKQNKNVVAHDETNKFTAPVIAMQGEDMIRSPVPAKSKGRRSPLKGGRRFIPLIDSDDEEENQ